MKPYADTNFFTRLYLRLPDSERAADLLQTAAAERSPSLPVTWLHRIETINAFQLHVFTGKKGGHVRVTREQAAAAQATFESDISGAKFLRSVPIDLSKLEKQFEELSLRHTANLGFRTYDLIHISLALLLNCDAFWSFDPKASTLATLEGLAVI